MNKQLEEEIKYYTELLRALIIGLFGSISGVVSLAINYNKSVIEFVLIILGAFCIFVLGVWIIGMCSIIKKKIKKLKS